MNKFKRAFAFMCYSTVTQITLSTLLAKLDELSTAIDELPHKADSLTALVELFQIVSPWHDRGMSETVAKLEKINFDNRYTETIRLLALLEDDFMAAGRYRHGWNRTEKGEAVTDQNVWLGNVCGLWTKTVAYWKTQTTPISPEFAASMGLTANYATTKPSDRTVIEDLQARPFVTLTVRSIQEKIQALKSTTITRAA